MLIDAAKLALLEWVEPALLWLIGLLPEITFDLSALATLGDYMDWVACYVDLPTVSAVLAFIVATEGAVWLVQGVVWLWDRLPLT